MPKHKHLLTKANLAKAAKKKPAREHSAQAVEALSKYGTKKPSREHSAQAVEALSKYGKKKPRKR